MVEESVDLLNQLARDAESNLGAFEYEPVKALNVVRKPAQRLADSSIYIGEWNEALNLREGRGVHYTAVGSKYEGS